MASVFISHSSRDKAFAQELVEALKALKHEPWIDARNINAGESLPTAVCEGVRSCQFLVALLTPDSIASEWVKKEWELKVFDDIQAKTSSVIPVLLKKCEVPAILATNRYIDWDVSPLAGFVDVAKRLDGHGNLSNSGGAREVLPTIRSTDGMKMAPDQSSNRDVSTVISNVISKNLLEGSVLSCCSQCHFETRHRVLGHHQEEELIDEETYEHHTNWWILKCLGCSSKSFRREHRCWNRFECDPETDEPTDASIEVEIFPKPLQKDGPDWFGELEPLFQRVFKEIYSNLNASNRMSAAMGLRLLVDLLIQKTVGPQSDFTQGLEELRKRQFLYQPEHDRLQTVVKVGSAAAHRAWVPTETQLNQVLDCVETAVYRLIILPARAREWSATVPDRPHLKKVQP